MLPRSFWGTTPKLRQADPVPVLEPVEQHIRHRCRESGPPIALHSKQRVQEVGGLLRALR
jgi:hypothetical protein